VKSAITSPYRWELGVLLRGEPDSLCSWLEEWNLQRLLQCIGIICVGAGLYGAAMGCWRAPLQAAYVALKFPMIILLTTLGNSLLNAMLAPLLGLNLTWRQSFQAILMSFTISAAILGSFSPLTAFLVWNTPPLSSSQPTPHNLYASIQLTHVGIIAFSGLVANLRLEQLLTELSEGNRTISRRVLAAWLAGNLFLGSQLCYILRPFIGLPDLAVQLLRPDAFHGNFFESVYRSLCHLLS
jgi:hypothetical protein